MSRLHAVNGRIRIGFGAGVITACLLVAGCGSDAGLAVRAPITVTAPPVTVTESGNGHTQTTTVVVTTSGSASGTTVTETETVTRAAGPTASTADTSTATPTGLKVGGAGITDKETKGSASITAATSARKLVGTGDYGKPPAKGNYVLIDVTYLCTTGTFDYNPYDWKIRDSEGRTYDSSSAFDSGYDDQALHSGTIGKGAKARGTLVFDAPKGPLTLEYGDGYDQAPATWIIPA